MLLPTYLDLNNILNEAGEIIRGGFGKKITITIKEDGTPLTPTDIKVNDFLRNLAQKYNNIWYVGEEGNSKNAPNSKYALYVDPLDGTGAFTIGIPTFTIVATIMEIDDNGVGRPLYSIIHDPILRRSWISLREIGVYYYDFLSKSNMESTLLNLGETVPLPYQVTAPTWIGIKYGLDKVNDTLRKDNRFSIFDIGGMAIAGGLIAQGGLHCNISGATSAVEHVAMSLIVSELGGIVTDLSGQPIDGYPIVWDERKQKHDFYLPNGAVISTNQEVHETVLQVISSCQ